MKKVLVFSFLFMAIATISQAQPPRISIDVILGNRPPAPSEAQMMRAEEQRHPNIARAMHDIERSMQVLHEAPDEFGGHKAQAESDLRAAYVSLRKALYFRLYEDRH